jgi:hypothetical protein
MLHKLVFALVAATVFTVPTVSSATEGVGQPDGKQSYQKRGSDFWDRQMQQDEGHYGLGAPDSPSIDNYNYDYDQDRPERDNQ